MAMVNFDQSVNCNAQSVINDKTVLYMNALIPTTGSISVNKSIQDRAMYFEHQEVCDADYAEFNQKVEDIAKSLNN